MSTPEELEAAAKMARRKADIAKHKPLSLEQLDAFGEDACRKSCHAQIDLMQLASGLQNAYAAELRSLWDVIKTLRAEAMYWREKYEEQAASR